MLFSFVFSKLNNDTFCYLLFSGIQDLKHHKFSTLEVALLQVLLFASFTVAVVKRCVDVFAAADICSTLKFQIPLYGRFCSITTVS